MTKHFCDCDVFVCSCVCSLVKIHVHGRLQDTLLFFRFIILSLALFFSVSPNHVHSLFLFTFICSFKQPYCYLWFYICCAFSPNVFCFYPYKNTFSGSLLFLFHLTEVQGWDWAKSLHSYFPLKSRLSSRFLPPTTVSPTQSLPQFHCCATSHS